MSNSEGGKDASCAQANSGMRDPSQKELRLLCEWHTRHTERKKWQSACADGWSQTTNIEFFLLCLLCLSRNQFHYHTRNASLVCSWEWSCWKSRSEYET
jgi:hypothetical protein